jgi:hypothetical protein
MKNISMDTLVELHNKGEKTFKSMWDSKEVKIPKGKHIEVVYGLALHFQAQSDDLEIKEIVPKEIEKRTPTNPLEEKNRGKAFEELE